MSTRRTLALALLTAVLASTPSDAGAQTPTGEHPTGGPVHLDFELGVFTGLLRPSSSHNLRAEGAAQYPYELAPEIGLRSAWRPVEVLSAEFEAAWMWTSTERDASANLFAGRVHALGQLPLGRATPFALLGGGALGAGSATMGTDTDPAVHFGVGVKLAIAEALLARLDVRDTLTQRFGSAQGALAHHPELSFGVTVALEPRRAGNRGRDRAP